MLEKNVLFIGNSYTYYNEMPIIFARVAYRAGVNITVSSVTKGGWTLKQLLDTDNEYGRLIVERLNEYNFDYVVLQEQSLRPLDDPEGFYDSVRKFAQLIRSHGAVPVLYATWGRHPDHPLLKERGWTSESMANMLADAYDDISLELHIPVAHVGLAFRKILEARPNEQLYDPDMTHPSEIGSTVAATMIFQTIFDVNEDGKITLLA